MKIKLDITVEDSKYGARLNGEVTFDENGNPIQRSVFNTNMATDRKGRVTKGKKEEVKKILGKMAILMRKEVILREERGVGTFYKMTLRDAEKSGKAAAKMLKALLPRT